MRRRKKDGVPGGTFVREAVQTTCDQCLRPLGTVLHQQEHLWRVHAHPPDLQARDERGDVGQCEGMQAQGQSWGGIRDQAAGGTLGLWRRNWQERADLKYSHR